MSDSRKALKQAINDVLTKIQELETTAGDFQGDSDLISAQLDRLVVGLQKLHQKAGSLDYKLPSELLTYLDKGGNPDTFTGEIFARANRANQYSKGKVEALQGFRDELKKKIAQNYPQEAAAYEDLLQSSLGEQAKG